MKNIEFINAGAGSGKTSTLTWLLTEYLDEEHGGYKPSQVILTTFTELAAAEFREKARGELLKKGWVNQASQLETASIGTVHSVVFSFVKKFWYLLGRGAMQNVLSEGDRQFFIDQSLASLAKEEDVLFFEKVLREFNFSRKKGGGSFENPDFWKEDLNNIIEKMVNYEIDELDLSFKKSKDLIDEIFTEDVDVDKTVIRDVFEKYAEIAESQDRRKHAEKGLKLQSIGYSSLVELYQIEPTENEKLQIQELDDVLTDVGNALSSRKYGDLLKKYIERIFELAKEWKKEFEAYKAKNRLIDYNDMEKLFLDLLDKEEVQQEIKSRFKLVFVDEFQDSSPIQVKIFDKLSDLVEKSIWVGDPKQAIYGFRGSDTMLINAVTGMFNQERNSQGLVKGQSLNKSYRSRKDLVELSNAFFERAFSKTDKDDIILDANRNDDKEFGEQPPSSAFHWHLDGKNITEKNQRLAQKVVELLKGGMQVVDRDQYKPRGIQPEDVAILCKTNRHVNSIANVLQEYGVKTTGQKADESFMETAEVKLFLAILNFLQNTSNKHAKAEILHLTNPDEYSVENIIASRMNDIRAKLENSDGKDTDGEAGKRTGWKDDHPVIEKIRKLSEQLKTLPVPDLVERIMIELDLKSITASWGNHEKRQKNLDALVQHALDYDQQCLQMGLGASLNNFIVYLNALDSQEHTPEKVKGAVNVLTYHKAKGLEWNLVILENLDDDTLKEDDFIKSSYFGVNDMVTAVPDAENLFPERYIQLLPWFRGSKKKLPDDLKEFIQGKPEYKFIERKVREELKRLLYVGVTRARDYLVTVSYKKNPLKWIENAGGKKVIPANNSDDKIDLWDTGKYSEFEIITDDPEFEGIQEEEQPKRLIRPSGDRNFEERYVSPSKVSEDSTFDVEVLEDFAKRISLKTDQNTEDSDIGNCLHHIYYSYRREDDQALEKAESILRNLKMRSVFTNPQEIIDSIENLYHFLEKQYGPAEKVYKELPLQNFIKDGQVIRGSIDLVWETKEGMVVVDYKSYPGGIKNITDQEDDHYAGIYGPQLLTYQRMLETAGKNVLATCIYYAVMGVVAEVQSK